MLQLIKKDLYIHKLSWLIYFAMLVFFMYFNKDIFFVIALMSAIVTMYSFYYDEQANGHKLWNSLPFTRSEIVSARYFSLLVVTLIMTVVTVAVEWVLHGGWDTALWPELIGSFVLLLISGSIFFPLFYTFAQRNAVFILVILSILFVIAGVHVLYYSYIWLIENTMIVQSMGEGLFWSTATAVSLVSYGISWGLSIKIYKAKELL